MIGAMETVVTMVMRLLRHRGPSRRDLRCDVMHWVCRPGMAPARSERGARVVNLSASPEGPSTAERGCTCRDLRSTFAQRTSSPLPCMSRLTLPAALGLSLVACGPAGNGGRPEPAERLPFARSEGSCRALAPDTPTGEQALRACAQAGAQLGRLLESPVPAGLVVVGDSAASTEARLQPGERWIFTIDTSETSAEREIGSGRRMSAMGYLTHETAHRVAVATIYPSDTTFGPDAGYGSPLPDWLDEALALLTEPATDQRARLSLLFADGMIYALPLRRFLYMPHPALANAPPGSQVRRVFYGQSLAFALFVRERAGDAALGTLVRALRAGEKQGAALTTLPGMPADGGALEQAWLAWLRARRDASVASPAITRVYADNIGIAPRRALRRGSLAPHHTQS